MKTSTIFSICFITIVAINLTLAFASDETETPSTVPSTVLLPHIDGLLRIDSSTGLGTVESQDSDDSVELVAPVYSAVATKRCVRWTDWDCPARVRIACIRRCAEYESKEK